ncbi:MAG TPA: 3-hydroxyacyl-CoA dehydrogenase family protein [Thermodesulfobacteriota bacterium]|nr:3-hydroxyacyl-CoA dehydrogenase family protein [Thermodesulfobacteriota bacterium]
MADITRVTVSGAGIMGHSLAQAFSQGGCDVFLHDIRDDILEGAKRLIASNLSTQVELGLLAKEDAGRILGRIQTTTNLKKAAEKAEFVLEAITEDAGPKKELFANLDRICPPETILASNTSYLDIFKFVETRRPDKVLITHWFAPPHLIPLVEIVKGPHTSRETVDKVKAMLVRLGKRPIVITKFLPGFIANRLQAALRLEAHFLLDNGYATPEDIDEATKYGYGVRIPLLGLFQREDFAGLDTVKRNLDNRQYTPPEVKGCSDYLNRLISEGKKGVMTGSGFYDYHGRSPQELMKERDIRLIKLLDFLQRLGDFR